MGIRKAYLIVKNCEGGILVLVAVVDEGNVATHPPHIVEVDQGCVETQTCSLHKKTVTISR